MESFFKKYGIFIVLGVLIIIVLLNIFLKSPNDKLKKYLANNNFVYNSDSELIKEDSSLAEYENQQTDNYHSLTFNYNNSTFYEIIRSRENDFETIYSLSFNIMDGTLTGDYKEENEFDSWFIDATYNSTTSDYNCSTNGFKDMAEYCDVLQEKIKSFELNIYNYLTDSNTSNYYYKKMDKSN